MNIVLVLSSARLERKSELVYSTLGTMLENTGHSVFYVDVKEHVKSAVTTPAWGKGGADEKPTEWKRIAGSAEVFIFVMPEYNRGYPGEWKLLIDSLGKKDYAGKPVYMVGVSSGQFGGSRVLEHVQPVLWEIGLKLMSPMLYVANVKSLFNEEGAITDNATKERMEKFVVAIQ